MNVIPLFRRRGDRAADALTEVIPRTGGPAPTAPPKVTSEARQTLAALVAQVEAEDAEAAACAFEADPLNADLAGEHARWYGWGTTMPDNRQPMARRYYPGPDALAADIGSLGLFRDTVRSAFARTEPRHGCGNEPQAGGWQARYASVYRHRTEAVPEPDYDIERVWSA